jgi:acyl carrier protein
MTKEQITEIVINNVNSLVDTFPESDKFEVNENTILFGHGSNVDSLSLVSIIVDLEMLFSDECKLDITLTDDRAMIRAASPFSTISSLSNYIFELISEQ